MSPLIRPGIEFRTALYYTFLVFVAILFIAYAVFQARFLIAGPQIIMTGSQASVQQDRVITLTGTTKNIVMLTLNDREIYTDKNGVFTEALVLENGYTVATLTAHDRYGRTHELTETFVYAPAVQRTEVTNQ